MNLRTTFFLWISGLLVFSFVAVGSLMLYSERRSLMMETEQRHRQMVLSLKHVCEEALYKNEDLAFLNYVASLRNERGFLSAAFVEENGRARMHSNPDMTGRIILSPDDQALHGVPKDYAAQRYRSSDGEEIQDLSSTVFFAGERVGTARLFLSQKALDDFLNQSALLALKKILLVLLLSLLIGFAGAFWLAKTLVSPIQSIVAGMKRVSEGRLDPLSFPERRDEIGWMGREINKTIAKLKELDEMKRDFVAAVTHELRSPLAAIESVHRFILGQGGAVTEDDRRFYLIKAQNNVSRLSRLIDDLLAAAKIEAGKIELNEDEFDLAGLVSEMASLYTPHAAEKKVRLITDIPQTPILVWGDSEKTTQILNNLISNAFKFTDKGYVKIRVESGETEALVQVLNTGLGIAKEDKDQFFKKFHRAKSSSKKQGTGLGLYISKEFVEMQGGRIWVDSQKEGGTVFSFTMKRNPMEAQPQDGVSG